MLTGRGSEEDKVKCLNIGADDYITKPFSATEVLARVRAVLRRTVRTHKEEWSSNFSNGHMRVDFGKAEVFLDNKQIQLTATEYRLLTYFAKNQGKVITTEELLTSIWGPQYRDDKEILWVSIARLRQKLERNPKEPELIVTRSGLGYLMPKLDSSSLKLN
jgi:DNA-binding response OmpR family regulator